MMETRVVGLKVPQPVNHLQEDAIQGTICGGILSILANANCAGQNTLPF